MVKCFIPTGTIEMNAHAWIKEFPGAITVCDAEGIITEMNEKAIRTFEKDGGRDLIGKNLLDCHPEPSRSKVKNLLTTHAPNVYTIEKNGIKKLIFQSPWYDEGKFCGLVELSLEIPFAMPHFIRSSSN
jgi:transcriptional regulator with PAS, ATPase and Fis domain